MKKLTIAFRLSAVLAAIAVLAQRANAESLVPVDMPGQERPKVGLVLSGGGARGAAHVGVLEVLEEQGVEIDYIAGTSMGAIVGGLYAAGFTPAEIGDVVDGLDWSEGFEDATPRKDLSFRRKRDDELFLVKSKPGLSDGKLKFPSGIVDGQKINLILHGLLIENGKAEYFDELRIPFRAVATDLVTGSPVVIDSGSVARALRASMSIPAVFAPIIDGDRVLVDGGVSSNLPVNVVRQMGADIVIAVDVSTPLAGRERLESVLGVTEQLVTILTRSNTEREIATLTDHDLLLVPVLGDVGTLSFDSAADAIRQGRVVAEAHRKDLARIAYESRSDNQHAHDQNGAEYSRPVISEVIIDNHSAIADQVIESYLDVPLDAPLDTVALADDLSQIYGLDLFSDVSYDVVYGEESATLKIRVVEKPWGPDYLQFGASISDNLEGQNIFNLAAAYTRTAINPKGGEWRSVVELGEEPGISTEIYQPIDYAGRYFINPAIEFDKRNVNVFDSQGGIVSQFRETRSQASIFVGREFGTWGQLSAGLRRVHGRATVRIGDPMTRQDRFDGGDFLLRFAWDELDNFYFPRSGSWGVVEYLASRKTLGADRAFEQIMFNTGVAHTQGRTTLSLAAMLNTTLDDDAPIQNLFQLGGFGRLSGFQEDELSGQQAALITGNVRREVGDFNLMPVYVGTTLEYGNTWQSKSAVRWDNGIWAGSVYLGVDSFFGPVYLGYGVAEGGFDSAFFFLGQVF